MIRFLIFYFSHHAMPSSIILLFILIMSSCCSSQQQQQQQQQDEPFIIRTIEKLPVHTEVLHLRRLLFVKHLSESINADFSLAKRDDFPYMYFLINHSSRGILTIRKEIDRDELCRLRRCRCDTWCDLELEILINSEQFNIELITIRIIDRNDHQPTFLNDQLNLTIVENAPIGAVIKLESAIDHDQGQNSIIGYSLFSSTALPFSLRYDLIRSDLSLIIDQILDREVLPSYQFDIIARDGDNQTGVLHVFVAINDINDSPPKFDQLIYVLNNISESIAIDSIISRVHASDADEGVNGEIHYHLISSETCFHIDQITGDIRVKCQLDYESQTVHRLEIEARDGGEGSKTDFCTVLIHILDENDNSPRIDIYPDDILIDSDSIQIYLNESLSSNSLVLSFSIVDRDSGDNGRMTWKLHRASLLPFELIRLTETTGELRTKESLDRELISEYNLTLEATDHGRPFSKSTRLNIQIIIEDENDHVPIFRENNLTITINEHVQFNHQFGYEIFQVHADDLDQDFNGEIVYSLVNNYDHLFQIDSNTGIIRAMKEFDRKQKDTYVLHVEARDQGTPSLSSKGMITFKVISRNEYSPNCDVDNQKTISWSIMENTAIGTIVGILSCRDEDQDELNGRISVYPQWFSREHLNEYSIPFQIITMKTNASESTISVILSVNGSIDRELVSYYFLNLTIADHGNPRQSINLSLSVDILDENDHCPQLHIDSSFLMINRDLTVKPFQLHLIASDHDEDLNGNITFQLSPSTSPSFIHLYTNGTLEVQTHSLLIPDDSLIVLHVQIRDHGQPTPCLIVETLRLFLGSNRTDWMTVLRNNNYEDPSLRLATEEFQQGKRMAHAYTMASSSISSPLFQYSSSFSSRKQLFAVFIGSSILMFIVIITMVLCFIDCLQKKTKQKSHLSLRKSHAISNHNSTALTNGKLHSPSQPIIKPKNFYDDDASSLHHYKSLQPVVVIASSTSHSSSSIDSTTRANTAHNRAIANTYTYTALSTSDDLLPVDFDDNINSAMDDNGVELMMTTV